MSALQLVPMLKVCNRCKQAKANRIKGAATIQDLELMVAYLKQGD